MPYLAHTANEAGKCHELKDHLRAVGELAAEFAGQTNRDFVDCARWAGMPYELGKYRDG